MYYAQIRISLIKYILNRYLKKKKLLFSYMGSKVHTLPIYLSDVFFLKTQYLIKQILPSLSSRVLAPLPPQSEMLYSA